MIIMGYYKLLVLYKEGPLEQVLNTRAEPNVRIVFASGPNSGQNSYLVFGQIVAVGPNTNNGYYV